MARIPYADPATASEDVRDLLARLPVQLNVFRMMAVAETNFRPLIALGSSILAQQQLDARLRELLILRVARLSRCQYEWVQHVPIALAAGCTEAEVKAIERDELGGFDARTRVALELGSEVLHNVRASDATLAAARAHLSDREVVEAVVAVGYYMMVARLLETTGVDLDAPAGTRVVDAIK
jgi:AhpD family alkylhydroperoxidase